MPLASRVPGLPLNEPKSRQEAMPPRVTSPVATRRPPFRWNTSRPPTATVSNVATAPSSIRSSGLLLLYVVAASFLPFSLEPADTTNGVACSGAVQSFVNVIVPVSVWVGTFMLASESSGQVAVAPPVKIGSFAAQLTRYVPANATGQLNVTASSESVTIFVTVNASVPPTVTGDVFSKRIVSPEPGAVAGVAPSTSQFPGTAQSAPLAPFHTYSPVAPSDHRSVSPTRVSA